MDYNLGNPPSPAPPDPNQDPNAVGPPPALGGVYTKRGFEFTPPSAVDAMSKGPPPIQPVDRSQQSNYNIPEQAPQPGLFDGVPFHDWIAKNSVAKYGKPAYDLTDDEIRKGFDDYSNYNKDKPETNGPLANVIGHLHASNKGEGSDKAMESRIANDIAYHRMMGKRELDQHMGDLKSHLQTLRPAAGTTTAPGANADGTVPVPPARDWDIPKDLGVSALGGGASTLGSVIQNLPTIANSLNPIGSITSTLENALIKKATGYDPSEEAYKALTPAAQSLIKGGQSYIQHNLSPTAKAQDTNAAIARAKFDADPNNTGVDKFLSRVGDQFTPSGARNLAQMAPAIVASALIKNPAVAPTLFASMQGGQGAQEVWESAKKAGKSDADAAGDVRTFMESPENKIAELASGAPLGSMRALQPASKIGGAVVRTPVQAAQMAAASGATQAGVNAATGATGSVADAALGGAASALPMAAGFETAGLFRGGEKPAARTPAPDQNAPPPATGGEAAPPAAGGTPPPPPVVRTPEEFAGYQTRLNDVINNSVNDLQDVAGKGTTPAERFNSTEVQVAVNDILGKAAAGDGKTLSPDQELAARNEVAKAWATEHDIDPNEVVQKPTAAPAPAPAATEPAPAPGGETVEDLIKQATEGNETPPPAEPSAPTPEAPVAAPVAPTPKPKLTAAEVAEQIKAQREAKAKQDALLIAQQKAKEAIEAKKAEKKAAADAKAKAEADAKAKAEAEAKAQVTVKPLVPDQEPGLPANLSKSAPRYGNRIPKFLSAIDKALYIVRNGVVESKAHEAFMEYLRKAIPGASDPQIRAMGEHVKTAVKAAANNSIENTFPVPKVATLRGGTTSPKR